MFDQLVMVDDIRSFARNYASNGIVFILHHVPIYFGGPYRYRPDFYTVQTCRVTFCHQEPILVFYISRYAQTCYSGV